ncbi:hypothetical protein [Leifsonia sp. NPDC058230]|uniref:hypothetical protein n=1 Tax=Leifsonia sp. NPDC058230 TaxID=3346391 RepID=UPI0036DAB2F8
MVDVSPPDDISGDPRYDRPLGTSAERNLSVDEVRLLWNFIHGDIMDVRTRNRLREHWGMCSRHAWAYAVVEIELWEAGAGRRGGHQPFDVSILYQDLLVTMRDGLARVRGRRFTRTLQPRGGCVICDKLHTPAPGGIVSTHAGFALAPLVVEANGMIHTRVWLDETLLEWQDSVCPECSDELGIPAREGILPCRSHLAAADSLSDAGVELTRITLAELQRDIRELTDSMTQNGAPSTRRIDASWVRTLGWFHGWRFPLELRMS